MRVRFLRFLVVGASGFMIDAGGTQLLIQIGVQPWLARMPAIFLAMTFTWLANRNFTYEINSRYSTREFVLYVLVAVAMAVVNYILYLVLIINDILPVVAVAIATICQAVLSYHLYRIFVFK